MKKIYVLDTNVLLQDPYAIYSFEENHVVIPAIVLEEVDSKKTLMDEIGRNARTFSKLLDNIRKKGKIFEAIPLDNGGTLKIELSDYSELDKIFVEKTNDNRIISVANKIRLSEEESEETRPVVLVSKDTLVRVKADALGIQAEDYMSDRVINDVHLYKGLRELKVDVGLINNFYNNALSLSDLPMGLEFHPHEFVLLKDSLGSSSSAVGIVCKKDNVLKRLVYENPAVWGIEARNLQQTLALELLMRDDIPFVTLVGKAGTGKTLLSLASGLEQVQDMNKFVKLLIARAIVPLGNDIGYLPGEKQEKLRPWMQPIYDNLEFLFNTQKPGELDGILDGMGNIEVEALTYVRGRSIPKQYIIIDEVQNLTKHEVKTILTRVGERSKIVLMGDPAQIDHPYLDEYNNGLTYAVEKFKDQAIGGHITLEKGERSHLAQLAADIL
ncbi:PhoH family protein (plasmid) [Rossellomorea sp. AcN35-11]|nr:PhoH family protein [Rossellomorea aquimaris]WJV32223.1 PhoH family protein [Rossellomorea sp. AcN35-11]